MIVNDDNFNIEGSDFDKVIQALTILYGLVGNKTFDAG